MMNSDDIGLPRYGRIFRPEEDDARSRLNTTYDPLDVDNVQSATIGDDDLKERIWNKDQDQGQD